ncbi:uncharacterized protein BDZ99DRAFT_518825 [Mytilinidion resinicola]|uniref:Uncharacterized protein n=1 Tax=Mytilinidion resinicola TaxID=574789 RepID=A0A6A6YU58_9PEZI|nr:uncharacterized protein BDZ99DRAFT_518825 [Mytilinidion resinicola]KAF2811564.1 hypothetical protein BDZ99DRAFT_518825 [Mytilinidion resinicola]
MRPFSNDYNLRDAINSTCPTTTASGPRLRFADIPALSSDPNVLMPPFYSSQVIVHRAMVDSRAPCHPTEVQLPSVTSKDPTERLKAMLGVGESLESRVRRQLRASVTPTPEKLEDRLLRQLRASVPLPPEKLEVRLGHQLRASAASSSPSPNRPLSLWNLNKTVSDSGFHQWPHSSSTTRPSSIQSRPVSPGHSSDTASSASSLGSWSSVSRRSSPVIHQASSMSASKSTLDRSIDPSIIGIGNVRPRPTIETPPSSISSDNPHTGPSCNECDTFQEEFDKAKKEASAALVTQAKYESLQDRFIEALKETRGALVAKSKSEETLRVKAIEEEQEDALHARFVKLPKPGAPIGLRELRGHYSRLRKEKDELKKENDELKKQLGHCEKARDKFAKDYEQSVHEKHHIIHQANAQTEMFSESSAEALNVLMLSACETRVYRTLLADRNEQLEQKTEEAELWKQFVDDFLGFLDVAKEELGPDSDYMQNTLAEEKDKRDTVDYLKEIDEKAAAPVSTFIQFGLGFPSTPSHDPGDDPDPNGGSDDFDDPLALRSGIGYCQDADDIREDLKEAERVREHLRLLHSNKERLASEILSGGHKPNQRHSTEEVVKYLDETLRRMELAVSKIANPALYKDYEQINYKKVCETSEMTEGDGTAQEEHPEEEGDVEEAEDPGNREAAEEGEESDRQEL